MLEVIYFLYGFSAVVSVYEIAKTAKCNHGNKMKREIEKLKKLK